MRVEKLLDKIYHRGPEAYTHFKAALGGHYQWLVDKLDSTENVADTRKEAGVTIKSKCSARVTYSSLSDGKNKIPSLKAHVVELDIYNIRQFELYRTSGDEMPVAE